MPPKRRARAAPVPKAEKKAAVAIPCVQLSDPHQFVQAPPVRAAPAEVKATEPEEQQLLSIESQSRIAVSNQLIPRRVVSQITGVLGVNPGDFVRAVVQVTPDGASLIRYRRPRWRRGANVMLMGDTMWSSKQVWSGCADYDLGDHLLMVTFDPKNFDTVEVGILVSDDHDKWEKCAKDAIGTKLLADICGSSDFLGNTVLLRITVRKNTVTFMDNRDPAFAATFHQNEDQHWRSLFIKGRGECSCVFVE